LDFSHIFSSEYTDNIKTYKWTTLLLLVEAQEQMSKMVSEA
jgi:hypothetical protein